MENRQEVESLIFIYQNSTFKFWQQYAIWEQFLGAMFTSHIAELDVTLNHLPFYM